MITEGVNRTMLFVVLILWLLMPAISEADTASNLHFQKAEKAFSQSKYEEAVENYKLAIADFEQQKDKQDLAIGYRNLGRSYRSLGRFDEALELLNKALKMHQEMNDRGEAGTDLTFIAIAHQRKGDYDKSRELSEKALTIHTELQNREQMARTLENFANIYYRKAEYDKSIDYFLQSLVISKEIGNKDLMLIALTNLSPVYWVKRDFDKAIEISMQAEQIAEELGDEEFIGIILGNRAIIYGDRGDYLKELQIKERCLAIFQKTGNLQHLANVYQNIGGLQINSGNYGKAQEAFQKSLDLAEKINDKPLIGVVLTNMAELHLQMGRFDIALDNAQKSLKVMREVGEQRSAADALEMVGMIHAATGNYNAALKSFKEVFRIGEEIKDEAKIASGQYQIGVIYAKLGDYDQALANYTKALSLFEAAEIKPQMGKSYMMIGSAEFSKKEFAKADEAFSKSIALLKETGTQDVLWRAIYNKGLLNREQGNVAEAANSMKEAVEVLDRVRAEVFLPEQKWMFLEDRLDVYEDLVRLLINSQNIAEAFDYAQKSKARAFLDLLSEAHIDPQQNLSNENYEEKKGLQAEMMNLNQSIKEEYENEKLDQSAIGKLQKERNRLDDQYLNLMVKIRQENPRYAALQYPEPLKLADAQKFIDKESVLMEYFVGKKGSFCFVITADDSKAFSLPNEKNLNEQIKVITEAIQKPDSVWETTSGMYRQYATTARLLYKKLLEPAGISLQKKRIIIAPDGMLGYLPFESLLASGSDFKQIDFSRLSYVGLKYEIQYVPSISVLAAIEHNRTANIEDRRKALIAFADPLSQPGLSKNISGFDRSIRDGSTPLEQLPYAKAEVEEISKLYPKASTTLLIGKDATEENAKQLDLQDYRVLHFASHGLIDEDHPQFSSLILNAGGDEDGYLTMREVFDLKLNADLVVLSACKSGLGQRIRGEGVTGLSRSFFGAGASSVLVSLWNVSDRSTADFMTSFYGEMQTGKLNEAAALKAARRKMILSKKYSHPYYWSPFILIGRS
jgi:CHAT domain-containing protein/tetratricopeptide (TPR) repeat protein